MTDELENDRPKDERRRAGRALASVAVSIRQRGRHQQPALMTNLSPLGCALSETFLVAGQQTVWVRLPGLESQAATMRWSDHGKAGVAFDHPLHPLVVQGFAGSGTRELDEQPLSDGLSMPSGDGLISRKAQILAGWADPGERILAKKQPSPGGNSFRALIRRRTTRVADHRRERRYPPPEGTAGVVRLGEQIANVLNLSASGLQVEFIGKAEIGSSLPVIFEGFDGLTGQVIWARGEQLGLALPRDSIDLRELPDGQSEAEALN